MSNTQFTLSVARKILKMLNGESIASSSFSAGVANVMLKEGLITVIVRGSTKSYRMNDSNGCRIFVSQHYTSGMPLEEWIELMSRETPVSRAEQITRGGHSKLISTRSFKGFLVNCYEPVEAWLNDERFVIQPVAGTSLFIEDFTRFRIPEHIVVVGVENGENFQNIRRQRYLFEGWDVLFVSRYPQSKDLLTWLQQIPNRYLHFGDFDLAGIHIFLNEYYSTLGDRASFFIPKDIEERLKTGSTELYDKQYDRYKNRPITDNRILFLADLIHRYRRVYEQEGYIEG